MKREFQEPQMTVIEFNMEEDIMTTSAVNGIEEKFDQPETSFWN